MNEFQIVPIGKIVESSTNPRRRFSEQGMLDLTESVRKHGVLVPLLVRPVNGHLDSQSRTSLAIRGTECPSYEIIAGARRFRAAKAAELGEIPVRVKEISDTEALELQILENLQREDVHPLEEALGYQALMERAGYEVAAIAAKVAKSESYVYQRLKLAELIEPAKDAFLEDRITAGHAILIARLQAADQEKALEACFQDRWGYGYQGDRKQALSVRDLSRWIEEEIHLDLHAAPFKKDDADLVPASGPCTTCPKRTGFVPALFPDIAKNDTCTDRSCYAAKLEAHTASKKAELVAKGEDVVEITTDYSSNRKAKADDPLPAGKYSEIRDKKDRCKSTQKGLVVAGGRDRGKVIEICADPQCKKHHLHASYDNSKYLARQKRQEEQTAARRMVRGAILQAVLSKAKAPLSREDLVQIALGFWIGIWSELQKRILSRRGWTAEKKKGGYGVDYEVIGRKNIALLEDDELAGFLLELSVARQMDGTGYGDPKDRLKEMAARYKVNVKAVEKQVTAELAQKKKAKKQKTSKSKGKKASSPKKTALAKKTKKAKSVPAQADDPACEICGCRELMACPGGCSWSPIFLIDKRYVCSVCEEKAIHQDNAKKAADLRWR